MKSIVTIIISVGVLFLISFGLTKFNESNLEKAENFCKYRKGCDCRVLRSTYSINGLPVEDWYVTYKDSTGRYITKTEF